MCGAIHSVVTCICVTYKLKAIPIDDFSLAMKKFENSANDYIGEETKTILNKYGLFVFFALFIAVFEALSQYLPNEHILYTYTIHIM